MTQRFSDDVPRLKDIALFGGLSLELIHRRHFPDLQARAAESWTKRRVFAGILEAAPLDSRRVYYHLTKKGADWLRRVHGVRVSRAAARPLRPMAKAMRIAAAEYCTPPAAPRLSLIRPCQHPDRFPDLAAYVASGRADPLRQKLLYEDGTIIGFLAVDRGQEQFIRRKVQPKAHSLSRWTSLRTLIDQDRFRLTILTPTASRRDELVEAVNEAPPPFSWEVVTIPQLLVLNSAVQSVCSAAKPFHSQRSLP